MRQSSGDTPSVQTFGLRPWQRLSVRLACLLTAVTLLAAAAVGGFTYKRHQRELEDTVGTQLLNIARVTALAVDPSLHGQVQRSLDQKSAAYLRIKRELVTIQNEVLLTTPIVTLTDLNVAKRTARILVVSDGPGAPGDIYQVPPTMLDPLRWTFEDGVARYTQIYTNDRGTWISAFAPILDRMGQTAAVVTVNYPVEIYLDRLQELRRTILWASGLGAVGTLILGFLFARRLTRPIRALTIGVMRVAGGDLSLSLPVRSRDEVGQLTRAFNQMLDGLRQRDFIRSAFGRYVSPEVAKALLESPGGLRFGGEKRLVTVLMSDLRGYTRYGHGGAERIPRSDDGHHHRARRDHQRVHRRRYLRRVRRAARARRSRRARRCLRTGHAACHGRDQSGACGQRAPAIRDGHRGEYGRRGGG